MPGVLTLMTHTAKQEMAIVLAYEQTSTPLGFVRVYQFLRTTMLVLLTARL